MWWYYYMSLQFLLFLPLLLVSILAMSLYIMSLSLHILSILFPISVSTRERALHDHILLCLFFLSPNLIDITIQLFSHTHTAMIYTQRMKVITGWFDEITRGEETSVTAAILDRYYANCQKFPLVTPCQPPPFCWWWSHLTQLASQRSLSHGKQIK